MKEWIYKNANNIAIVLMILSIISIIVGAKLGAFNLQ
jgi:hypothetical protein